MVPLAQYTLHNIGITTHAPSAEPRGTQEVHPGHDTSLTCVDTLPLQGGGRRFKPCSAHRRTPRCAAASRRPVGAAHGLGSGEPRPARQGKATGGRYGRASGMCRLPRSLGRRASRRRQRAISDRGSTPPAPSALGLARGALGLSYIPRPPDVSGQPAQLSSWPTRDPVRNAGRMVGACRWDPYVAGSSEGSPSRPYSRSWSADYRSLPPSRAHRSWSRREPRQGTLEELSAQPVRPLTRSSRTYRAKQERSRSPSKHPARPPLPTR